MNLHVNISKCPLKVAAFRHPPRHKLSYVSVENTLLYYFPYTLNTVEPGVTAVCAFISLLSLLFISFISFLKAFSRIYHNKCL